MPESKITNKMMRIHKTGRNNKFLSQIKVDKCEYNYEKSVDDTPGQINTLEGKFF